MTDNYIHLIFTVKAIHKSQYCQLCVLRENSIDSTNFPNCEMWSSNILKINTGGLINALKTNCQNAQSYLLCVVTLN